MKVLDTNILIYAYSPADPRQRPAAKLLQFLANGRQPWGITTATLAEFLRATTHANIGMRWTPHEACEVIEELCDSPSLQVLAPGPNFSQVLAQIVRKHHLTGNRIFDAQIAAICVTNAVSEIVTEDRSFVPVAGLKRLALKEAAARTDD